MITSSPYFWFFAYLGIFARYLLIAGIAFLIFYVFFKKRWSKAKIQERFPKGTNKHWFGKWLNTSTNHNMHHKYGKGNYGLYFTFWDDLMGTTHPKYHETFENITVKKKSS